MIFMVLEIRSLILALRVEIYDSQWTLRTKRNSDDGRDKYNGNVTRMRLSWWLGLPKKSYIYDGFVQLDERDKWPRLDKVIINLIGDRPIPSFMSAHSGALGGR